MKKIIFIILLLAFFLQFSFFPMIFSNFTAFNFLLMLSIILSLRYSFNEIYLWVILGGLFFDTFSFFPWGTGIISMIGTAWAVSMIREKMLSDDKNIFLLSGIFLVGKLIFDFFLLMISKVFLHFSNKVDFSYANNRKSYIIECAVFLFLGLVFLKLFRNFERMSGRGAFDLKLGK